MRFIPKLLLRKLYTRGSLRNTSLGIRFGIKNRLSDATITAIRKVSLNGVPIEVADLLVRIQEADTISASKISADYPIHLKLGSGFDLELPGCEPLPRGQHQLVFEFEAEPIGKLNFDVSDRISESHDHLLRIPRYEEDDYAPQAVNERQQFAEKLSNVKLDHVKKYSIDPHLVAGNCEHFIGTAQVPIGIAGPLTVNGDHAQGDFVIPLATTEGTLVASYNRGCKLLNDCGGVKCTVVGTCFCF